MGYGNCIGIGFSANAQQPSYAVGFGFLVAGVWSATGQIVPKTSPEWLSYTYLNGSIPWLGLAVSRSTNILFYPAFFMILFYSSHYLTNAWTKMQWRGILIFFIAGLGVMTLTFENYSTWIISGVIVAVFLWAAYYFFLIKKYTHEYD
jgi:hypothetical protein